MTELTHLDEVGQAHMVDVSGKPETEREAVARGQVLMKEATIQIIREGAVEKGDVLAVARLAGIMAAKKVPELIPLCHPLLLDQVKGTLSPHSLLVVMGKLENCSSPDFKQLNPTWHLRPGEHCNA